jgi:hypothetical protein
MEECLLARYRSANEPWPGSLISRYKPSIGPLIAQYDENGRGF